MIMDWRLMFKAVVSAAVAKAMYLVQRNPESDQMRSFDC